MFSDNIHTAGNHGNGVLRGLVVEAGMGSNMRTEMCRTLQGMCRTVPQRKGLTHFLGHPLLSLHTSGVGLALLLVIGFLYVVFLAFLELLSPQIACTQLSSSSSYSTRIANSV